MTFLVLVAAAAIQAGHDRHVFFDRSLTDTAYYYSDATATVPSALANVRGRITVETHRVRVPPNGLRLAWTSRMGGTWRATIRRETWRNQIPLVGGDTLVFWAYTDDAIPKSALPLIGIEDGQKLERVLQLGDYLDGIPANQWVRVALPVASLAMTLDYGIELPVAVGSGGPLFFTHYSFLGFDPRGKRDRYTNYFDNNRRIAQVNRATAWTTRRGTRAMGPRRGALRRPTVPGDTRPTSPRPASIPARSLPRERWHPSRTRPPHRWRR